MEMRVDLNSSIPLSYFSEYIEREHPKREPVESKALSRSGGERLVGGSSGSNRTSDLAITIEHDERPPSGEEHWCSQNPDWQEVGIAQTTEHEERLGISYFFQKKKQGDMKGYFHNTLSKSRSIRMTPWTEASQKEHSEPLFRWDPDSGRHPHRTRFYLRCAKLPSCCNAWGRPHSPSTSIHLLHEGRALYCVLGHVSLFARCTHRCANGAPTAVSL